MDTELNRHLDDLLREKVAENELLKRQLKKTEEECRRLKAGLDQREKEFSRACAEHASVVEELGMAKLIVDQSPVILFRRKAGDDPTLEYISENLRQFGYGPEEFFGDEIMYRDIVYKEDSDRLTNEIKELADADLEEYTQYYRIVTKAGEIRWVEDQTSVVRDEAGMKTHNQGILIDITERRLAEEKLRKSEEKFRRIVETAAEGFLLMDESLTITDLNKAYCKMIGYSRQELLGKNPLDFATDDFRAYMLANSGDLLQQEYREFEGSMVAKDGRTIPILIHGSTLRDDKGQVIGNMAFITDMSEQKKALELAAEVQKSLLPQEKPVVVGLDIAGRNVSCDEIGGDYYDFLWRQSAREGAFSIVVGDISGHGVDSALLMTTARAFLRMRASQPGTIAEIISEMNSHLAGDVLDTGKFMTLFYLSIDPAERSLSWVRAGHDPALLYSPDTDTFDELKGTGMALGVMDDFDYTANQWQGLKNGQIIAVGTDGIWEAFNTEGQMFGKKRLCDIIQKHASKSADEIVSAVYAGLNDFMSGTKSEDDITLVIIRVDGL